MLNLLKATLSAACLIALAGLCGAPAVAAGSESPTTAPVREDANYAAGKQAIAASDWKAAEVALSKAVAKDPGDANAQNLLAYSYRKLGNLAKAEEHLAALDRLCTFSCEEYRTLKKAVADYKQKSAAK